MARSKFQERLRKLINEESVEGGSETPDFVLAEYLVACLDAFDAASQARQRWHGQETEGASTETPEGESAEPRHLPCKCGHFIDRITKIRNDREDVWWCGACGRLATVEDNGFVSTWWVPNSKLKGMSWEDMRTDERRLLGESPPNEEPSFASDLDEAVNLLRQTDLCDEKYEDRARRVWELLDWQAQETLIGLIRNGPVWDGDVCSKTGRNMLIELGLATKAVKEGEQGYQVANYEGWRVWKHGHEETS